MFTAILTFLTSISGLLVSGGSFLFNWIAQSQAAAATALQNMVNAINQHEDDGQNSVDDRNQYDNQIDDLDNEDNQLDNPPPPAPVTPAPAAPTQGGT